MSEGNPAHWGSWMCPTIDLEAELELERGKRALQAGSTADVLTMAMKLWRLTIQQDAIIRGAARRIMELEGSGRPVGHGTPVAPGCCHLLPQLPRTGPAAVANSHPEA